MPRILAELYEDLHDLPDVRDILLLVVGTSLEAELTDRALAYHVRERIYAAYAEPEAESRAMLRPVVVSDLWYVNDVGLHDRPALAIGRPESNAATAMIARGVPTRMIADDRYRIQLDPEGIDVRACLWGTTAPSTADAVEHFLEQHLAEWLDIVDDFEAHPE